MPADRRPTGQVTANYVSGEMTAGQRNVRLRELGAIGTEHRRLLSNARCLTEGVDVPTLDGVVFIDPKRSEVDIVQAVGRAIRKAPDKTVGTIVIPVFMSDTDDHEAILDDSPFKIVWDVIRALRMHDEELAEQLDSLRLGLGYRGAGQPRLPEKIHLDLPTHISADFARAFNTRLVSSVTASWLEMFGVMKRHYEATGTTRFPQKRKTPDGYPLGDWEAKQRDLYRKGKLSAERFELLNNLGDWSWEPFDEQFERFIEELHKHLETSTTTRVSQVYKTPDSYALGARIGNYRAFYRNGKLSAERAKILSQIGDWTWEPQLDKWGRTIEELQRHYDEYGTTHVIQRYKTPDGYPLGARVGQIRLLYKQGKLSDERIEQIGRVPAAV